LHRILPKPKLSLKITFEEVIPAFLESLDCMVLAQPISQVIPEIEMATFCNFVVFVMIASGVLCVSVLHAESVKTATNAIAIIR
jgi:hypothetical protein